MHRLNGSMMGVDIRFFSFVSSSSNELIGN
jgi:hypothetical protein